MSVFIRKLKAVLIFYRTFVIPAMLINILALWIMRIEDPLNVIGQILVLKIFTDLGIAYILIKLQKASFYFYYNMGLGRTKLFSLAFLFDLFLLVSMAIIYFSIF